MLGDRSWDDWISQYERSHQDPRNRLCHTIGIPTVALGVALLLSVVFVPAVWPFGLGVFAVGWAFQFAGHWFEGKPPEFFSDWRFLFVGLRWWLAKVGLTNDPARQDS